MGDQKKGKIQMGYCGIDQISPIVVSATAGTTTTVNCAQGVSHVDITLTANITTLNASGSADGERVNFRLLQDGTGSRTVGWGTMFRFTTALAAPTITTTADGMDSVVFEYNAAHATYDVVEINQAYVD